MTSLEQSPGARRCANCNSRLVKEKKESPQTNFIVLKISCQMCRHEYLIWSGTKHEYKIFNANRSMLKRLKKKK